MKIAITSAGNSLESKLDSRFGRCSFFVVYDTESKSVEFVPNSNKENVEGAGPASVNLLASRDVRKVVSGEFGAKVKSLCDSLKIQLIVVPNEDTNIIDIIRLLERQKQSDND